MIQSVCILGRQPALGLAELESLYGAENVEKIAPHVAGLQLDTKAVAFPRLGGSTRLARVLAEIPSTNWKLVEKELAKQVRALALPGSGKVTLGLSAYGLAVSPAKLNAAGLTLKKILRASGRSVRLVPNPELELNTAQVLHNHLTNENGVELLCIATGSGKTLIARTTDVQDIDSYTLRDRGRPKRDARVGMLPPKLAQIIINLAAAKATPSQQTTVLDPFCGTGVVLQESILMGFSVFGSDLEPRMVQYTKSNIDWLIDEGIAAQTATISVDEGDATTMKWSHDFSVVACETYLGRALTALPDHGALEQNVSDVNTILTKFLRNIHDQLPAEGRMCIAVPAWQIKPNTFRHLPLIDQISDLGYNQIRFEHVRDSELLYYREDQIVARELLVLIRK